MSRQTNHLGFGQNGRPSGIRPPSSGYGQSRPKTSSTSSMSSIPSTASSRKVNNTNMMSNMMFNFGGSGGSRASNAGTRQSVFANFRSNPFSSARKSVTAKLGPLFGLTPQHTNRQSYAPNSVSSAQSNRRSSIGGNRHIKDSRPLSDSQYQRQCVTKLIAFLTENGYPNPISKTLATRPTVGDISKIFEYNINMDPIRTFYPNFEGEIDIKTELINLCLRTNSEGLDGDQIDSHLQDLLVKTYGTEDDFEQMVDEQEGLEQEVRRLEEDIQQIKDMPNTLQTYQSDIKNYDQYMSEMRAHYKENEDILENLDKESTERLATIKKTEEQKKQLKLQVEEQEFGLEEAVLAKERKQQLEEEIKQEFGIIEDIKKSIRGTRLECSKYEDTFRKMHSDLDSFITAMTDLVESPVMNNYSSTLRSLLSSSDWNRILDEFKAINGETNGTNISELEKLFSNRVHELKIAIVQQLSSLQGCVTLAEHHKLNELNLLIEEKEKQLKHNEKQVSLLMSESETMRKEQVSQIGELQSDCDRTRQMLSQLDGNTKRTQSEEKQNLQELRKQVEEKEIFVETELNSMVKKFEDTVSKNKMGLQEFTQNLDKFIAEQQTKTTNLKKIFNKFGSNSSAGAPKDRKTKEKRKKDKENKEKE